MSAATGDQISQIINSSDLIKVKDEFTGSDIANELSKIHIHPENFFSNRDSNQLIKHHNVTNGQVSPDSLNSKMLKPGDHELIKVKSPKSAKSEFDQSNNNDVEIS